MIIFGSPGRYIQGPGAVARLGNEISKIGKSAVLLADTRVSNVIGDVAAKSCAEAGIDLLPIQFSGEITREEIDRLAGICVSRRPDVVIGAGGGKTIDCAKALAGKIGSRIATVPTIASNDSPTSHIIVVYDENHKLVGVDRAASNPDLVLVDTAVIARAPAILLTAGIGDAVVKLFEAGQCARSRGSNMFGGRPPLAALALAEACYDNIRKHSVSALEAVAKGEPNEALERVVEASVLMSGLAFESGGLSICHALTRGLSAVKGPAEALHGLQVAYGLMVQLELERRDRAFVEDVRDFFKAVRLPVSLAELDFKGGAAEIRTIAELTVQAPHMKNFERPLTADDLVAAIEAVEAVRREEAAA